MAKRFAGIGARDTPPWMRKVMAMAAEKLALQGWALASGGAPGADRFFQEGAARADTPYKVYLPYSPFKGMDVSERGCLLPERRFPQLWPKAMAMAESFHPNWAAVLAKRGEKMMARNMFQVLGDDLASPVRFVLCWAKGSVFDDKGQIIDVDGGTGQAVRVAAAHHIPVYNLAHRPHLEKICTWLDIPVPPEAALPVARRPQP